MFLCWLVEVDSTTGEGFAGNRCAVGGIIASRGGGEEGSLSTRYGQYEIDGAELMHTVADAEGDSYPANR